MFPIFIKVAIVATLVAAATTGVIVGVIVAVVPSASDNECLNIQPASDIKVDLKENHIVIQWSASKSNCDLRYNLTVKMEGDVDPLEYETTQTFYTISRIPIYCSTIDVTLMAVGEESESDVVTLSYSTQPSKEDVDGIKIIPGDFDSSTKELSWTIDKEFLGCTIKYDMMVNGKGPYEANEERYQLPEDTLNPICQDNDVSIKVKIDDTAGPEQTIDEKIEVIPSRTEIEAVRVIYKDFNSMTGLLSWNIDREFMGCTVTFDVIVNNEEEPNKDVSKDFVIPADQLESSCKNNVVRITPKVQTVPGSEHTLTEPIIMAPPKTEIKAVQVIYKDFNSATGLLSWDIDQDFTGCTITFDVIVNDEEEPNKDVTKDFVIPADQLESSCKNNVVRITPKVQTVPGNEHTLTQDIKMAPSETEIQAVQVIYKDFNPATGLLSWDIDQEFTGCIVTFDVSVNDKVPNEDVSKDFVIPADQLESCKNNVVKITPIVQTVPGSERTLTEPIIMAPSETEIQAVQVIYKDFNPATGLLSWDIDQEFTGCTITFDVTVNDEEEPNKDVSKDFVIPADQLESSCKNNVVRITPKVQTVPGSEHTLTEPIIMAPSETEIQAVQVIYKDFNPATGLLSWDIDQEFTGCTITFDVTVNDEEEPNKDVSKDFVIPADQLESSCKNNVVRITPKVQTVPGSEHTLTEPIIMAPSETEIQAVQVIYKDFNPATGLLSWDIDQDFTGCTITFDVIVNDEEEPNKDVSKDFVIPADQLESSCKNNVVRITPKVQTVPGSEHTLTEPIIMAPSETEIQAVQVIYKDFNPATGLLSWDIDKEFTGCTITFDVIVNDEEEPNKDVTKDFVIPADQLESSCKNNVVRITLKVQTVPGSEHTLTEPIIMAPSETEIQAVQVIYKDFNPATGLLSWDIDKEFTGCTITFDVIVNDEEEPNKDASKDFVIPADQLESSCKNNVVRITPKVQTVPGSEHTLTEPIIMAPSETEIQAVQVVYKNFDPDTRLLSWEINPEFTGCTVTFDVTVNDEEEPNKDVSQDFPIPTEQLKAFCENNVIKITPKVQTVPGIEHTLTDQIIAAPASIPAVKNGIMNFLDNKVKVTWDLPDGLDACDGVLKYNVELTKDGGPLDSVSDHDTREWISKELLEYNSCVDMEAIVTPKFSIVGTPSNPILCT